MQKCILYVETNLLMSIATGREPEARRLLAGRGISVSVVIPQICIMEAYSALDGIRKARTSFEQQLRSQVTEMRRDVTSRIADRLAESLNEALIANRKLIDETDRRLKKAVRVAMRKALLLPLSTSAINSIYKRPIIMEPRDNLILHCILEDARTRNTVPRALLTENTKEFDSGQVRAALADVGITKYFHDAKKALGWITSLPNS